MRASSDTGTFVQLQFVRIFLASVITLFLARSVDLGVSTPLLLSSVALGSLLAGYLLSRGTGFITTILLHTLLACLCSFLFSLANTIITSGSDAAASSDFLIAQLADKSLLLGIFYATAFLSTWFFWTRPQAVTLEAILFSTAFLWLLSGHRNYHIDAPRQISSLSWKVSLFRELHLEPQHIFLGLGVIFVVLLSGYFILASQRTLFGSAQTVKTIGKKQRIALIAGPFLALALLFYYAMYINSQYRVDLSRVSNGVGTQDEAKEGESNLGFHSAVSSTKQPSALVRLENDFTDNPWAPMLYFREGALSSFNGRELVRGGLSVDTDVPVIAPGQAFVSSTNDSEENRNKVVQSIYLLTDHKTPFAIDTPRRMAAIKNPYPERFRLAYQALSQAPTATLEDIVYASVGSSKWDEKTWEHYLRAPGSTSLNAELDPGILDEALQSEAPVEDESGEDLRYLALAKKLTEGNSSKVIQAAAIVQYLSEKSIYTKKPGHQVTDRGDPVAPYLFEEKMRGYCVHFAHAASYLMRLVGIPARIATGYLVDLTYAKDGHILLQMGDRHAWPEVYIEGHGWLVFDITPAQAENEQALVPDESILDELMSKLDPAQELLEPLPLDLDESESNPILAQILRSRNLGFSFLALLLAWIAFKSWLRFAYRLPAESSVRVRRAYTSFASLLADNGLARHQGETREEYAERLSREVSIASSQITKLLQVLTYRGAVSANAANGIEEALREVEESYDQRYSRVRRILSFLSPLSLSRWPRW